MQPAWAAASSEELWPAEGSTCAASGCTRNTRKRDFHPIRVDHPGSTGMLESALMIFRVQATA